MAAGLCGTVDTEAFDKAIINKIIQHKGGEHEPPLEFAFRRFWFETHVMTVSDLRWLSSPNKDVAPWNISLPEREAGKDRLKRWFELGLVVQGLTDPPGATTNAFLQMLEDTFPGKRQIIMFEIMSIIFSPHRWRVEIVR